MAASDDALLVLKAQAFDLMRKAEAAEIEKNRLMTELRRLVSEITKLEVPTE